MTSSITWRAWMTQRDIRPYTCEQCGRETRNFDVGYDDGRDPDYVGFRCGECGGIFGWTPEDAPARIVKSYRDEAWRGYQEDHRREWERTYGWTHSDWPS